jgi:hypothetical protein
MRLALPSLVALSALAGPARLAPAADPEPIRVEETPEYVQTANDLALDPGLVYHPLRHAVSGLPSLTPWTCVQPNEHGCNRQRPGEQCCHPQP